MLYVPHLSVQEKSGWHSSAVSLPSERQHFHFLHDYFNCFNCSLGQTMLDFGDIVGFPYKTKTDKSTFLMYLKCFWQPADQRCSGGCRRLFRLPKPLSRQQAAAVRLWNVWQLSQSFISRIFAPFKASTTCKNCCSNKQKIVAREKRAVYCSTCSSVATYFMYFSVGLFLWVTEVVLS